MDHIKLYENDLNECFEGEVLDLEFGELFKQLMGI